MALTVHLLREGDLFVDIGANVGSYTVLASGVLRAWAEALEPAPVTADILELNVRVNGRGNTIMTRDFQRVRVEAAPAILTLAGEI
jgi:FkbM family methyltransferase